MPGSSTVIYDRCPLCQENLSRRVPGDRLYRSERDLLEDIRNQHLKQAHTEVWLLEQWALNFRRFDEQAAASGR